MKTLHTAYRVTDLDASLSFYKKLGYVELGHVDVPDGRRLVMLKLPEDPFVALELVHCPERGAVDIGTGFSHLVVQTPDLEATLDSLSRAGVASGPPELPAGPEGPKTSFLHDPDGYALELVQWPAGHADGLTANEFA